MSIRAFKKELKYSKLLYNMANFLQSYARGVSYSKSGLKVRSGRLRNSIVAIANTRTNSVLFGAGVVYGRIQELGGTIRPKKAKKLWIPTKANLTPAGVLRYKPSDVFDKGFIRGDAFYIKEKDKVKMMFKLASEVEIKEKRYLKSAIVNLNFAFKELVEKWSRNEGIFKEIFKSKGIEVRRKE